MAPKETHKTVNKKERAIIMSKKINTSATIGECKLIKDISFHIFFIVASL